MSAQETPVNRCAQAAQTGGESLAGTAPVTTTWLLVEQPGTWGPRTLQDCGLGADLAAALGDWKDRTGGRVALIRRPGRTVGGPRHWFHVDSRVGREQISGATFAADADLVALLADDTPVGVPQPGPLYLVCAHGRHDACCAIRGRPVAAELAQHHLERVWESTHLGGHRFAANLVLLPHGVYYGHVEPTTAVRLVDDYERSRIDPGPLRGRSCFPAHVQAAQHHARVALEEYGLDALAPTDMEHAGPDRWVVRLARGDGDISVTLQERMADIGPLSCGDGPGRFRTFDLLDVAVPVYR